MSDVEKAEVVPTSMACEAIIQAGLATFIDVGEALADIQKHKLYRQQGFKNFDDYCKQRWDFDRSYASRLVGAAEVSKVLPMGNKPANERQARALAPLKDKPEKMDAAMTAAKEAAGGEPTAKDIAGAVADLADDELDAAATEHEKRNAAAREKQRGGFSEACRHLKGLPSPTAFLDYQGDELNGRHRGYAVEAHLWLSELLDLWEP